MLRIQLSAIRSSVFRAMFQHDMRESKSNEIIIPDLDFNTVKDMVRYVYSGRWISLLRVLTWVLFNFNQGEWSFRQVRPTSQCCWQIWHQVRNVSKEAFINWQLKLSIVILTRDLKEECCQSLSANLAVDQVISGWQLCIFFCCETRILRMVSFFAPGGRHFGLIWFAQSSGAESNRDIISPCTQRRSVQSTWLEDKAEGGLMLWC